MVLNAKFFCFLLFLTQIYTFEYKFTKNAILISSPLLTVVECTADISSAHNGLNYTDNFSIEQQSLEKTTIGSNEFFF